MFKYDVNHNNSNTVDLVSSKYEISVPLGLPLFCWHLHLVRSTFKHCTLMFNKTIITCRQHVHMYQNLYPGFYASLMYVKKNKRGPRIDPWGTPDIWDWNR